MVQLELQHPHYTIIYNFCKVIPVQWNNFFSITIKNELINNEIYKRVKDYSKNRSDLNAYYNVGKLLVEAQGGEKRAKYGDNLIKDYSSRLTNELGKGYSTRSLKNMRKFYLFVKKRAGNDCPINMESLYPITWY